MMNNMPFFPGSEVIRVFFLRGQRDITSHVFFIIKGNDIQLGPAHFKDLIQFLTIIDTKSRGAKVLMEEKFETVAVLISTVSIEMGHIFYRPDHIIDLFLGDKFMQLHPDLRMCPQPPPMYALNPSLLSAFSGAIKPIS